MTLEELMHEWEEARKQTQDSELTDDDLLRSAGYRVKTDLRAGQCPSTYTYKKVKGKWTCDYGC